MVASSALTVPYERLKPEHSFLQSIQDQAHYEKVAAQLSQLLKQPFLSSPLWNTGSVSSWASGDLVSVNGSPDEWPEVATPCTMSDTELVCSVLAAIRHALARGNLYMQAEMWDQSTRLVFVTRVASRKKITAPFRFVQVSPHDFRRFLNNWFTFLGELELPPGIIAENPKVLPPGR